MDRSTDPSSLPAVAGSETQGADYAALLVEVADVLVADFDLFDYLHTVTENAAAISGAPAVGLVLADPGGKLRFSAASNQSGAALELFQITSDEGPCQDCFRGGEQVVSTDFRRETEHWPTFAPRAVEAGFLSVHAFPMRLRGEVIGALNHFGTAPAPLDPLAVRLSQSLADLATISLLQLRSMSQRDALADQLQGALTSRVVIEQAKGLLVHRDGIDLDEAYTALRARARASRKRVAEVAAEVLAEGR